MNALIDALAARLLGDATFAGYHSVYKGVPALFTQSPIPGQAVAPYTIIDPPMSTDPNDTKTTTGYTTDIDIMMYAPANGDRTLVNQMAERARALLHRHQLVIVGQDTVIASVRGPMAAPSDDRLYGRRIEVTLKTREQ